MSAFQQAFDEAAPELIATAWDYLDRSQAADVVWVYVSRSGDWHVTNAYYQISGQPQMMGAAAKSLDLPRTHDDRVGTLGDLSRISRRFREAAEVEEIPSRMILRYRTADGDFSADFSYVPLWTDPDNDDDPTLPEIERAWYKRLQETGNDSAGFDDPAS